MSKDFEINLDNIKEGVEYEIPRTSARMSSMDVAIHSGEVFTVFKTVDNNLGVHYSSRMNPPREENNFKK